MYKSLRVKVLHLKYHLTCQDPSRHTTFTLSFISLKLKSSLLGLQVTLDAEAPSRRSSTKVGCRMLFSTKCPYQDFDCRYPLVQRLRKLRWTCFSWMSGTVGVESRKTKYRFLTGGLTDCKCTFTVLTPTSSWFVVKTFPKVTDGSPGNHSK